MVYVLFLADKSLLLHVSYQGRSESSGDDDETHQFSHQHYSNNSDNDGHHTYGTDGGQDESGVTSITCLLHRHLFDRAASISWIAHQLFSKSSKKKQTHQASVQDLMWIGGNFIRLAVSIRFSKWIFNLSLLILHLGSRRCWILSRLS